MVRDKSEIEKKMEVAVKALENVVKVMTRKVINLEQELVNLKDGRKKLFENKTKVGLGHQKSLKDKMNDFKEDISTVDPKSASSPKDKEKEKKEEVKEHFILCSKCNYKSKKESLLKKHMFTKHSDHSCKECEETIKSTMELLKHVAKHHVNEKGDVKELKNQGEEVVQNEKDQENVDVRDPNEVEGGIKNTDNKDKMENEENTKVMCSVSLSFSRNFCEKVFPVI